MKGAQVSQLDMTSSQTKMLLCAVNDKVTFKHIHNFVYIYPNQLFWSEAMPLWKTVVELGHWEDSLRIHALTEDVGGSLKNANCKTMLKDAKCQSCNRSLQDWYNGQPEKPVSNKVYTENIVDMLIIYFLKLPVALKSVPWNTIDPFCTTFISLKTLLVELPTIYCFLMINTLSSQFIRNTGFNTVFGALTMIMYLKSLRVHLIEPLIASQWPWE